MKGSEKKKDLISKPHIIQSTHLAVNHVKEDVVLTLSGPSSSGQLMVDPGGCSGGQRVFLDHGCNIRDRIYMLIMKLDLIHFSTYGKAVHVCAYMDFSVFV